LDLLTVTGGDIVIVCLVAFGHLWPHPVGLGYKGGVRT
jgi:hypothetical protein